MHYLIQPGPELPDRFAYMIGGLCHYLGAIFMRDRTAGPLTLLIRGRLRRLEARFVALVARVDAGTQHPGRGSAAPRAARVRSPRPMPRGFGWLCRLMPEGNVYASYLEELLRSDAELAALLAVAPQAGRMLRPVLWMMGREVPDMLRLANPPPRATAVRSEPAQIPDIPYREQPKGSRYPSSVWPSEAELKRAGRRLAKRAGRQEAPK